MTQHHGVLDHKVPDGAVLPVVHVGAADARVVDGHEHVVRAGRLGHGTVGVGYVMGLVEDEGEVLCEVTRVRRAGAGWRKLETRWAGGLTLAELGSMLTVRGGFAVVMACLLHLILEGGGGEARC